MKLFASVCAGTVMAAGIAAVPARAQVIEAQFVQPQVLQAQTVQAHIVEVADVLRSDDEGPYRAYVGPPVPMGDDTAILAPDEIPGILRQQGFSQLGPVFRRGWVYTVAVLNQNGDDGRLIVDARSGEPIRFIPAMRMDSRLRDELDRMYGPPGPPPARFAQPYDRGPPRRDYPPRTASQVPVAPPRHAAPLKRAAKALAKTAPKPNPATTVAVAPPKAQAPVAHTVQVAGTSGTAPKDTPKDAPKPEVKPDTSPAAAATVELKPTGPMPPVQPMD